MQQNQQILKDLSTKLSHLTSVQRKELAAVINQYREVFFEVPKHDDGFCTDFRKTNDKTKSDSFPIPRISDCIDQIGNAKFVSTFDMLKGYWQVPLTQQDRKISVLLQQLSKWLTS